MGFYDDVIVPHLIELACGDRALIPERQKAVTGLSGTVLEIGFGSGLNLPHYPPAVQRVMAVDPSARARHIGRNRIAQASFPIDFVSLDAQSIRADDASADAALSTFTLCSVTEVELALHEVRRILKPNGQLHFLEHGRAPDAGVQRWQDRLNGVQQTLCGGCNLNRDLPTLLARAGFQVQALEARYFPKIPRTHGYLFSGVAVAA